MMVETADLRPGYSVSRVIKGGWQLAGGHGIVDRSAAIRDMESFLDSGVSTFDCADIYVGVEEMIGEFVADLRRRRGAKVAARVNVHTKFVPDLSRLAILRPNEVEAIVDRSLRRLQVERLDLVQFFWWDLSLGNALAALEVLKLMQERGKIRYLGVTNWDRDQIAPFLDSGISIISAQVQYSVLDRRPAHGLREWAAGHNIQLLCYGVLAGGFLTEDWLDKPDPGFSFENRSLTKYRLIIDEFGPWHLFQELLRVLKNIGERHGVSLSSVATRWVLDQPQVAAAIIGARYASHLPQTLEVFNFILDEQDRRSLEEVVSRSMGPRGEVYSLESDRKGRHGRIMKYNLNTDLNDTVPLSHD